MPALDAIVAPVSVAFPASANLRGGAAGEEGAFAALMQGMAAEGGMEGGAAVVVVGAEAAPLPVAPIHTAAAATVNAVEALAGSADIIAVAPAEAPSPTMDAAIVAAPEAESFSGEVVAAEQAEAAPDEATAADGLILIAAAAASVETAGDAEGTTTSAPARKTAEAGTAAAGLAAPTGAAAMQDHTAKTANASPIALPFDTETTAEAEPEGASERSAAPAQPIAPTSNPASTFAAELARAGVISLTGRSIPTTNEAVRPTPVAVAEETTPTAETTGAEASKADMSATPTKAEARPVAAPQTFLQQALAPLRVGNAAAGRADIGSNAASSEAPATDGKVAAEPTADLAAPVVATAKKAIADVPAVKSAAADAITPDLAPLAEATTGSALSANTTAAPTDVVRSAVSAASAETTAMLGAQIAKRLENKVTRFDLVLTPEGLGEVDVILDIDADGGVTARLAFDNPLAAAELRARADELRRQLQDAGFTVAQDALSFSEKDAGQSGGGQSGRQFFDHERAQSAGRAFAGAGRVSQAAEIAIAPQAWASPALTPSGVDLRV